MITAIFIALLVIVATVLGVLFYCLNKRFEALRMAFNERLKILDERIDKITDHISLIDKWCEVLRENQDTLQGDLEKVYRGAKKEIRKVEQKQDRQVAEEKKPV